MTELGSKEYQCPRAGRPESCRCSTCFHHRELVISKAALKAAEARNFGTGRVFSSVRVAPEPEEPRETPRQKIERQKRERVKESEKTWVYIQANQARYAAQRAETFKKQEMVKKSHLDSLTESVINTAHYVGGITKALGDSITGGIETLINEPSMIVDAAKNIASTIDDGTMYLQDVVAPKYASGAKARTDQRIDNLIDGVSDSFEQAKHDYVKHEKLLADGEFKAAGDIVGSYGASIILPAKKVKILGGSFKPASFGESKSKDYKKTFFDENPELHGNVIVHHAVEQQVQRRYPGVVSDSEMHSLENLRGIPKEKNGDIHLSQIRKEWNRFYKANPNPTKVDLLNQATKVDSMVGSDFKPSVKSKL